MAGGQICCIIGCPYSYSQNVKPQSVKFHQITNCNAYKWLSVCLLRIRENALYYDRILLCSNHFAKSNYFHRLNNGNLIKGRILKRNAVPTIFPDICESEWYDAWAPIDKPMNPLIQEYLKKKTTQEEEEEDSSLIQIEKDKGEQIVKPNGEVNIDCLLEEIKRRPDIWSPTKPSRVRDDAWDQMVAYLFPRASAEELSTLGLALWNEWDDLKRVNERYLIALESYEKNKNSEKPTFNYAEQMQFLHPPKRLEVRLKDVFDIKPDGSGLTVCLKESFGTKDEIVEPKSGTSKPTNKAAEAEESKLWQATINGKSNAVARKSTATMHKKPIHPEGGLKDGEEGKVEWQSRVSRNIYEDELIVAEVEGVPYKVRKPLEIPTELTLKGNKKRAKSHPKAFEKKRKIELIRNSPKPQNILLSPLRIGLKSKTESTSNTISAESSIDRLNFPKSKVESPKSASRLGQSNPEMVGIRSRLNADRPQPTPQPNITVREDALGSDDDDRQFLISLVPDLKRLPETLKLTVRNEIKGIFRKYNAVAKAYRDHF